MFLCVQIQYTFFIHSSVDGHLGCFHVLAIVNSAAVNTAVHVSILIRVFAFSEHMPSGTAGSNGNSSFSFLKKPPYCFPEWLHQFTFLPTL